MFETEVTHGSYLRRQRKAREYGEKRKKLNGMDNAGNRIEQFKSIQCNSSQGKTSQMQCGIWEVGSSQEPLHRPESISFHPVGFKLKINPLKVGTMVFFY